MFYKQDLKYLCLCILFDFPSQMTLAFQRIIITIAVSLSSIFSIQGQVMVDYPVSIPTWGYRLDSTSYQITKIIDQRVNKEYIGIVYHHIFKTEEYLRTKKGIEKTFKKIFKRAFQGAEVGEREVLASIKFLKFEENEMNKFAKKGRDLNMGISVDYYEIIGEDLVFIRNDSASQSGIFNFQKHPFNDFLYSFFDTSLASVEEYMRNNPRIKSLQTTDSTDLLEEKNDTVSSTESDPSTIDNAQLTSLDQVPEKEERFEFHNAFVFERFYGNRGNGGRFRYIAYTDKWDNNEWSACASFDMEILNLNSKPIYGENKRLTVDYTYFALGLGTMKSLNNYLKLEFGFRIGYGSEYYITSITPRGVEDTENKFFAGFLNQRLHFALGKGFGILLSVGTYQSGFNGTDFLPSDIGFSFGGGIKF